MIKLVLVNIWGHVSYFLIDFALYLILLIVSAVLFGYSVLKIYRAEFGENRKKQLLVLIFSVFLLVVMYSFLEGYFRYRYDQSDGLGFLKTNARWFDRHVVFNTYGYRDRDFTLSKKPREVRIGVIGDSITMGYGIKNVENRFSNLLEKKLKRNGINAQVYNIGQSGVDTCSEIKEFNRVKQLNFDIMIWEYFVNDVQPCDKSTGKQVIIHQNARMNPAVNFLRRTSFFFDFIYFRFSSVHESTYFKLRTADLAQYHNPAVLKNHLQDVTILSKMLQDNSTTHKVVVVFFPSLFLLDRNYPAKGIHTMLDKYFQEQGNSVIDLLPYLIDKSKNNLIVNRFDSHPNEYVNDMVANLLYGRIVRIINDIKK